MRQAAAKGQPITTLQIDMNKAYNRVCHQVLWSDLYEFGIRGKLLKAIISTYSGAKDTIRIGDTITKLFSLPNGLRQGSVLSPVLYILYTIKLLWALEATNTGLDIDHKTKLPAIMFVDDLSTMAKNLDEAIKQYTAVQKFALTHRCVINTKKSSIATTGDTNNLCKALKDAGMSIKPTTKFVHLGAKHKVDHVRTHLHPSPNVLHRLSKARAMLHEMIARGLGNPNLRHEAMFEIFDTQITKSTTYSIASVDLTSADKGALDNVLADAVRAALQWANKDRENNEWVLLESNLLPPSVVAQMDEVATWIRASQQKINPIVQTILKNDVKLHAHVIQTCGSWGTSLERLKHSRKGELYKNMQTAYKRNIMMKPSTNEVNMRCTKRELGIHLKGTAVTRTAIHQEQAGALMRLRSILRHGHPTEHQSCAYCGNDEPHSVTHVITKCKYGPTMEARKRLEGPPSNPITSYLKNLTTKKLAAILGGPPPGELNLMQKTRACEIVLTLFNTSPLYHDEYVTLTY
jgi:hypothetical protein